MILSVCLRTASTADVVIHVLTTSMTSSILIHGFNPRLVSAKKTVARSSHSVHVYNVAANRWMATSRAPPGSP